MQNKTKAEQALQQLADQYVDFEVEGKKVPIPYILNSGRWRFWRTAGKGTPNGIRNELFRIVSKSNFEITTKSAFEIYDFMREHRIGIDCSGLAFHLLDCYVQTASETRLEEVLLRLPGKSGKIEKELLSYKRERRISAAVLTSYLNSVAVTDLQEIQIGDLIEINKEIDHVLVITDLTYQNGTISQIEYVHSSSLHTNKRGQHYGAITIKDITK